jgi:hypothetical protein
MLRDRYFESAKASLGDAAFQAALSEGRAMALTQAILYALTEMPHDRVPDDASRRSLTE